MHGATSLDKKAQEDLAEAIKFLEMFLSKTKYVACDHLTIADIVLMSSASTVEVITRVNNSPKTILIKYNVSLQAVDKTLFDDHPNIKSWMEKCKAEIVDYEETNAKGAEGFGHWAHSALSKLQS